MVKCTRSTDGSAFSSLRQARSPWFGSPDTSSTCSRSRTPLIVTTAWLLTSDTSPASGAASIAIRLGPTVRIGTVIGTRLPVTVSTVPGGSPSRRIVSVTGVPASSAPSSSTSTAPAASPPPRA